MFNNKEFKCAHADIVNLSIKQDVDDYDSSLKVPEVSEKFLYSASLLPAGEVLGWQIDTKTFSNVLFSSLGDKVSMKDYSWIFEGCAVTSPLTSGWMEDLYAEDRKVYILSSIQSSDRDIKIPEQGLFHFSSPNDNFYTQRVERMLLDLFEMMNEMGAVIRIIVGASENTEGHGRIFISLPDEITLRMRALLFIAFPHLEAVEIDKATEETGEPIYLPDDYFLESMTRMLSVLMCFKNGKEPVDEIKYDDYEIEDDIALELDDSMLDEVYENDDEEDEDPMGIDELELSIRSYNCLKCAGIYTVEELQRLSDDELMKVAHPGKKSMEEIKQKLAAFQDSTISIPLQETNYMAKLDELIGLTDVKKQIKRIAAFAKMKKDMTENGNADISVALNMGFVGNPGTAKTTVARIAAGIFYEIGLLPCNELIEVGRSDLVARYVGQTAIKVKKAFARAKGKVLFIDEAYSLVDSWESEFGDEAINTIVQEMENNRDHTIVIFAGYPDKMESFFSRNPGLKSRVPFTINFSDYSVEEMVKIAELEAKRRGFSINAEACGKVTDICSEAVHRPDAGNGRFSRNLIENAILGYASRIYVDNDGGADKNCILAAGDFTSPMGMNGTKKIPIGFHV